MVLRRTNGVFLDLVKKGGIFWEMMMKSIPYVCKVVESPVGALRLVASERGLAAVLWEGEDGGGVRLGKVVQQDDHPILWEAGCQLAAYFEKGRQVFSIDLDPQGSDFQKDVWLALREIPYGETRSYQEIAARIGRPKAARAVGAANRRNPLSIVVPCHRVIGGNGKLTGFAGGLWVKAVLLELESRYSGRSGVVRG